MRYAALLRAVNVGGRKVEMAPLRAALAAEGYGDPRTLLASGNIVLEAPKMAAAKLESAVERIVADISGVASDVMVRTAGDWPAILAANPFPEIAASAPNRLVVLVFKSTPDAARLAAYLKTYTGPEEVRLIGREAFIHYPMGQGVSKLALPKAIGPATARNWNTMQKLTELLAG